MAIDTAMFSSDLAFAEADLPQTVTIAGQTLAAIVATPQEGTKTELEGLWPDVAFTMTLRLSVITSAGISVPEPGDLVTYNGDDFRISRRLLCIDGVSVAYGLEPQTA